MWNPDWSDVMTFAGVALGVLGFVYPRLCELERRRTVYEMVEGEAKEALAAAHLVLSDAATPAPIRAMVLLSLQTVSDNELGKQFLSFKQEKEREGLMPSREGIIFTAMRELERDNPALAELAQEAAGGLLFCVPFMHADKIRVYEEAREAAVRPFKVWPKLADALASLWKDDSSSHGPTSSGHPQAA